MNKKFFSLFFIGAPLLLIGAGCSSQTSVTPDSVSNPNNGKVVVSVTDAAINMGDIRAIAITENRIELHSAENGWVDVATGTRTFNLLELKEKQELALAASADIAAGTYNQIRISVANIVITTKDGVTSIAKLPSNQFIINTQTIVKAGSTSSITLDFIADASLHITGNGMYIFSPVINISNRSDVKLTIDNQGKVKIEDGRVDDEHSEGMDIDGQMKAGFNLGAERKMEIDGNGEIKIMSTSIKENVKFNSAFPAIN